MIKEISFKKWFEKEWGFLFSGNYPPYPLKSRHTDNDYREEKKRASDLRNCYYCLIPLQDLKNQYLFWVYLQLKKYFIYIGMILDKDKPQETPK